VAVVVAATAVLAGCTGAASEGDATSTPASSPTDAGAAMSLLFVQTAQSGTFERDAVTGDFDLRLTGVDPSTTWFSDRPQRKSGSQSTGAVVSEWNAFGFGADPPNAALVISDLPAAANTVIVELREPTYDQVAREVRYRARPLGEPLDGLESHTDNAPAEMPTAFAGASLFIDDATVTATTAAGNEIQGTNVPGTTTGTTDPVTASPGSGTSSTVGLCTFDGPVPLPEVAAGGQPAITTEGPGTLGAVTDAGVAPTLAEAYREFNTLQCTHYQHTYTENPTAGLYYYDCVGFTGYAVQQAAPTAWKTLAAAKGIKAGYVPSPQLFQEFFASLLPSSTNPTPAAMPGWEAVPTASAIRPGDVLAWITDTTTELGHSVMALSTPVEIPMSTATNQAGAVGDTAYALIIMDSTATTHGPDDTRRADAPYSSRNAPLGAVTGSDGAPQPLSSSESTAPSGLGIGTIALIADSSGQVTGVVWSLGTEIETVPFGAGHPTS